MKKTFKTLIAMAAFSGVTAANVQAEEITVKDGDTLWGISKVHNVTVDDIKSWNSLSSDLIIPGDSLEVSPVLQHVVKEGESLWSISEMHHTSVEQIKSDNGISSEVIYPNQVLQIHTDSKNKGANVAKKAAPAANAAATNVSTEQQVAKPETKAAPEVKKEENKPAPPVENQNDTAKEITVTATAYTASCEGCSGITATGVNIKDNPDLKVISVDPSVIPLGSKVFVEGYGYATAADTGGAIKGNRIDVFIPTKEAAMQWGTKTVKVKILK